MAGNGTPHDPMKRSREAVKRAKASDALMKQARESRAAHRRGEHGTPGRALHEDWRDVNGRSEDPLFD